VYVRCCLDVEKKGRSCVERRVFIGWSSSSLGTTTLLHIGINIITVLRYLFSCAGATFVRALMLAVRAR
jgi:hypothetical protein